MASSLLGRRSNSTTSLSKFFHELPDPDQSSIDFCNSFWGPNDCGVEVLFARMRGAVRTMEEVRGFWKERIAIEEEYAKKLAKIAKLPLGRDEIGDLRAALDTLRTETDAQAAQHLAFVQSMKRDLDQPTNDFIGKQNNHKKTFQAAIEKSYKAKQTQEKYVEKAREKYESDCVLINSYTAQSTLLQGKELDKIQTKLERAQQTVQANERDYQNFARALGDTCKRWEGEWKTYCDQCQDLEDERIEFIKDNVWAYANAVSTVCVADDESCEKLRVHLEQVDADKEMEHFVKDYGTGPMMSEPMPFISYKQSDPPGRPKQKMANYLRSSVRAPLMRSTLPVGPPEPEPTGPGAAGIGAGGGKKQDAKEMPNGREPQPNSRQGPTTDKTQAPMSPASQSTALSYQQTGTSLASSATVSTTRNLPTQQGQRDSRHGVDPPTMLSIGGNAYPVDANADPQSARNFTGAVGDQNDPIAQALDALKKGGGVTRNGVGSIRSRAGFNPTPGPTGSVPVPKPTPSGQEPTRNKSMDYRDYANNVVGAHPSSRPTSPMSPPRAAMMQPPSAGQQDLSHMHQQAFPGERRLSMNRGQPGQQPAPVRSPSPARDGFAGIGAQGRSPSPQPFNRAPSPGVHQGHPNQPPAGYGPNPAGQRSNSSAVNRAPSPSFGIALDASGQVAQDSLAEEYARRSQYQQPPPPQQQYHSQQASQYQPPANQGYQQSQPSSYQPQQTQPQFGGSNGYPSGLPQQPGSVGGVPPSSSYNQPGYTPPSSQVPAGGSYPQQQQQPARAPSPAARRTPSPAPQAAPIPPQGSSSAPTQVTDDGANVLFYVKALYDYRATIPEEFDFQSGDIIAVTATPDDGWWSGMLLDDSRRVPGRTVFPSNFVKGYTALRGPAGQPQTALDTIVKLSDRLTQSTLISDRRAAVLGLKGLTRDCKADVGQHAFDALLALLETDAKDDVDSGRAILETLALLCQVDSKEGGKIPRDDLGLRHTDVALSSPAPTHALLALLPDNNFYLRLHTLQLLTIWLTNRPHLVQQHFQQAPDGPSAIEQLLTDNRDIIRAETLNTLQLLVAGNPPVQTSIAFAGAFEKLLNIIGSEGGIEGGSTVFEALSAIESLLRHNVGTQKFFRDLEFTSHLPALLLFPSPPPPPDHPVPQEFSLQFWNAQKISNAGIVISICQMLIAGKGDVNQAPDLGGLARCLVELALASNAPTALKTKALKALPPDPPLLNLITCYIPVPETNGEEWDRLPPEPAIGVLVAYALDGDFGMPGSVEVVGPVARRGSLELRAAALSTFEAFVTNDLNARLYILGEMASPTPLPAGSEITRLPFRILVRALADIPQSPMTPESAHRHQIAALLFTSLIRGSEKCKTLARSIIPNTVAPLAPASNFVEAATLASEKHPVEDEDDDPPQALLSTLLGNLAMSMRSRSISRERGERDMRDWDRVIVAYLVILSAWAWDSSIAVKDILEEGGIMTVLMEPVSQSTGVDVLVQGLCAFVLGACYEFNREPGEITRATLQPIFHKRIGADTFVSRMARLREDARFKAVTPDTFVVDVAVDNGGLPGHTGPLVVGESATDGEGEIWMDWAFVEFWKENYYTIQKSITNDPNSIAAEAGGNIDTAAIITNLKSTISMQQADIERLQAKLAQVTKEREEERESLNSQVTSLSERLSELSGEVEAEKEKKKEVEKEQEDLLVLLEELNTKRRKDKERMREKGMEVSEDEEEEGDDDDEEDEEEEA
ncbi:hypothetical protein FRC05_001856 [Tulasnella sp. 425]|nr:hypothetical protein FRC05_001856 [Tulasnella sp. 425]